MSFPQPVSSVPSRSRTSLAVVTAAAMALAALTVGLGSSSPAGAADGRTIEVSPTPERGYWLAGDPNIDFQVTCLSGESRTAEYDEVLSGYGWWGSDGFGLGINVYAPAGTYEVVVSCALDDVVLDSSTFTIEVGAPFDLVATVGTEPGECATTSEITVEPGTEVHWCYTLVPHPDLLGSDVFEGWYDEVIHVLSDTLSGPLDTASFDDLVWAELSSVDLGVVSSTMVADTLTNTGTWSTSLIDWELDDNEQPVVGVRDEMPVLTASATAHVATAAAPDGAAPVAAAPAAPAAAPAVVAPSYTG